MDCVCGGVYEVVGSGGAYGSGLIDVESGHQPSTCIFHFSCHASGEGEQEYWFEEEGCIESSKMESGSWRDCCQSGVNSVTPIMGINLDQNWN